MVVVWDKLGCGQQKGDSDNTGALEWERCESTRKGAPERCVEKKDILVCHI